MRTADHNLEEIIPILIGAWRRIHKESGPPDKLQTREFRRVVDHVIQLRDGLETGSKLVGSDYFADKNLLSSYMLYQWVVHYQQGISVIGELPEAPQRVLDICSGPGAFALAALKYGASEVIATDKSAQALQLGAEICGREGHTLKTRVWDCKTNSFPVEGTFDLIILGHCLTELFPSTEIKWPEKQIEFIQKLLNRLNPNGQLLIVDSSQLEINHRILKLRDILVEKGVPVQAPCVWKGNCPALQTKNSPCYAQREFFKPYLIREIQRAAQINLGSLKFSYIIFRNPVSGWPKLDNKPYYRIISPPIEAFHGEKYYICGTEGKKSLGSRVAAVPKDAKAYEFIKRGELITFSDVHETESTVELTKDSKLKVAAACGKPLPAIEETL
jgi:SAM-dependent methyltransferase